jgi:hypothetical protein
MWASRPYACRVSSYVPAQVAGRPARRRPDRGRNNEQLIQALGWGMIRRGIEGEMAEAAVRGVTVTTAASHSTDRPVVAALLSGLVRFGPEQGRAPPRL